MEQGVTPSRLKRLGKAKQREYVLYWFHQNYEDPANQTSYNSREGGYLYVSGGPYDAREELTDEFGSLVSEQLLEEVAEEVESEGIVDWAPGLKHRDHEQTQEEWDAEHADDEDEELPDLEPIIHMLEGGDLPNYGDERELQQRQQALADIAALQEAITAVKPAHGGIGHNHPPPDDTNQLESISQISEAVSNIYYELKKQNPDALEVARSTSNLKKAMGWIGNRANAAVDKAIGIAIIDTAMGSPFLEKAWSAVKSVSNWLFTVAPWPF